MNYVEYGKENKSAIILLHGGGVSWWNYREAAEMMQADYHVILPILDGHANSDRDFTTIEDNAKEIIKFVDERFGGSVMLIGGLSLGAQIVLEILSQRKNICRYALIESALVIPSKWTYSMMKPAFGSCYGLIHHKWFAKLQFKSLRIKAELFEDYFRDTGGISKNNMIAFLQENSLYSLKKNIRDCEAEVHIFVGEKENSAMRKSAAIIHENLQNSYMEIIPSRYHGEFSMNYAKDYVDQLLKIVNYK